MIYAFELMLGRYICVYTEGNNINLLISGNGRMLQNNAVKQDYQRALTANKIKDRIYIAYVNISGEVVLERIGGERLILFSDYREDIKPDKINIVDIGDDVGILFISQTGNGESELSFISGRQGGTGTALLSGMIIHDYELFTDNCNTVHRYLLRLRADSDSDAELYQLQFIEDKKTGKIVPEVKECILSSRETIDELNKKCLINTEECNKKLKAQQNANDERIKKVLKEQEKRFKKQYDELTEMAKNIQDEGRRWRELYYNSTRGKFDN